MLVHLLKLSLGPVLVLVLSGCTTYAPQRPVFAYYAVPCSTPGAFVAETPVPTYNPQAAPPAAAPPAGAAPPEASKALPPTCMIAAPIGRNRYSDGYYGRGYHDPHWSGYGGYGPPFYGSIGIGLYGDRHGWSDHGGHQVAHGSPHGGHSGH